MQRFAAYKGFSFLAHKEIETRIFSDPVLRALCEQFREMLSRYHTEPRSDVSNPVLEKFSEISGYLTEHHGLRVSSQNMAHIEPVSVSHEQQQLFT